MRIRQILPLVALAPCLAAPVSAGSGEPPEGLPLGNWILAPYFQVDYQDDDNIFRRNDENTPVGDRVTSFTGGLLANLPVRNSLIQLGYEATQLNYADNEFSRDFDQEVWTEIGLNFSSRDQLFIRERYNRGVTDLQTVDQGGELVFQGEPFNLNRWEVELVRSIPLRQGYAVRVTRTDLNFQGEPADVEDCPAEDLTCFPFFDYRGFDMAAEYRQPLGPNNWFLARHGSKRFNHYGANRPDLVGIPFRREEQDSYGIGLRGTLGGLHPYFFYLGHGRLRFRQVRKGGAPADFDGISGAGSWVFNVAGNGRLSLAVDRRPLPSNFNTYYLVNQLRLGYERQWLRRARYGVNLLLGYNRYGGLLTDDRGEPLADCGLEIRKDRLQRLEGRLEWFAHPRVGFQVRAGYDRRGSNCDAADFDATVVSTGVRIGWF